MTKLTFHITTDVYVAGIRSDDGMPYTAEVYCVQAEAADGRRWNHHAQFAGCKVGMCVETGETYFADVRQDAQARAQRLLDRILAAGGSIDLTHWSEGRPAYGSDAYCGAEEALLERMEDGQGGYELARIG